MKDLTSLLILFVAGCTALPAAILPLDAAAAVVDSSSTPLDAAAAVIESSSTPHDTTEDPIHPLIPIPCCPRLTPPLHPTLVAAKFRCRPCMHHTHSATTVSKSTHTSLAWFNNFTVPVPTSSPSGKSFIIEEIFPPKKSTTVTTATSSKISASTTSTTTATTSATTTSRPFILEDIYPINSNAFHTTPPSPPFELTLSPTTTITPSHHNHPIFCLHRPGQTTHKFCIPVEAAAARTTLESVTVTGTWVPEARGTEAAVV